jgi:WD40 repeat protein
MNAFSSPRLRNHIVTAAIFLLSAIACGQTVDTYLVSDFDSGHVQIFSVANNQLLATIQTGASPHDALVAAGGRLAFVPNGNSNYLSLLDLSIGAEIARLPQSADTTPFAAAITPDGSRVLMVAPGKLVIMNTSDFSLTTVPLGTVCDDAANCDSNPADIHIVGIAIARNKAYLNLDTSFPVRIVSVDLNSFTVSQVPGTAIGFGNSVNCITVSPDGSSVIAKRVNPRALVVIDTSTNTVTQTLTPSIFPRQLVATTPGGAGGGTFVYLLGTDFISNVVTVQAFVLSGGTLTLAGSVSLFPFQNGLRIALSPDSTQLYVGSGTTVTALNTHAIISNPAGAVSGQFAVANLISGMSAASVQLQPLATAPNVSSVVPNLVVSNDTDANRTIQLGGTNFSADALLRIGNLAPFASGASSSSIQAIIPAGTAAQVANLIVTDPDLGSPLTGRHQSGILRGQLVIASPPTFQPVNQVVVANFGNSTAAILNVSTNISLQPEIPGALGAEGIAITSDGERAYIGQFAPAAVHVFNLVQNQFEAGVQLDLKGVLGQVDALALAPISPFGTVVYAVAIHTLPDGNSDQQLFVIDADPSHAGTTLNTVLTSQLAGQVLPSSTLAGAATASPGGRFVYTNALQDFTCQVGWLIIFDMATRSVNTIPTSTLNVDGCQLHIEITPDGKFMLLGGADGKIHIFDIGVNPMNPAPFATITPHAPVSFSVLSLPSLRIVPGTPNRLLAYDSTQNLVAAFNFDPVTQDFSQLGAIFIPGPTDFAGGNSVGVTPDGSLLYAPLDGQDDVAVVDTNLMAQSNPAALLTKISTGLAPFTAAVRPGTPTPLSAPGNPVVNVVPTQGISISFSDVTTAGVTTISTTNVTRFGAPAGFQISTVPVYYEIATTAAFSNAVACFQYNPALVPSPESSLRLAHYNTEIDPVTNQVVGWEDVTISGSPDVITHTICGQVSSFSPFIIGIASTSFLFNSLLADISVLPSAGTPVGIMRSLRAKVLAARNSVTKGNNISAANQLNALVNQLQALSGNQLKASNANALINETDAILNSL